jgi:hypothetical protein
MKVISFLTDFSVVDRIIDHLKLTFAAQRPSPPHLASGSPDGRRGRQRIFFMIFCLTARRSQPIFGA